MASTRTSGSPATTAPTTRKPSGRRAPAGKVASGGGYFVDNPTVDVIKSYPGLAGYAWTVVATNPDSSDHSVTTWVLCVEGSAIDGGTYTPGP